MKLARSLLAVLSLALTAIPASAAIWTSVDNDFQTISYTAPFTDPTVYTITVKNTSANNYTNVHFVVPFHYEIDQLPTPTTAVSYPWNNGTSRWESVSKSIQITGGSGVLGLVTMSNTDIPLTYNQINTGAPASILATDSVPIMDIGTVNAGQTISFTLNVDFTPGAIKSLGVGFFVVPEPGSIGLLAIGAMGLLARRRKA